MAYVVPRRGGRFEIRESRHTPRGPRARTLAGFRVLNNAVLTAAAAKATRRFDKQSVLASARRAGAELEGSVDQHDDRAAIEAFVAASRKMAKVTSQNTRRERARLDPGAALIDLLGFADEVRRSQPPRPAQSLTFPVLASLPKRRIHADGKLRRLTPRN